MRSYLICKLINNQALPMQSGPSAMLFSSQAASVSSLIVVVQ